MVLGLVGKESNMPYHTKPKKGKGKKKKPGKKKRGMK